MAREMGFRSVSVDAAICYVPRVASLQREYRRKVRTMSRGLQTLFYKRHLMNPIRYGGFAWMLMSHKLARWLVPWFLVLVAGGAVAALWGAGDPWRWLGLVAVAAGLGASVLAWLRDARSLPVLVALPAYVFWGVVAGLHACIVALRGEMTPVWEPTRRDATPAAAEAAKRA
jgi:hypothetical protein